MNEPALNLKSTVPQRLDLLLAEGCSRDAFLREVSALCAATPEAPWETLALLDQYYRRGKLSTELFLAAKTRIERRVLGVQDSVVYLERTGAPAPAAALAVPAEAAPAAAAAVPAEPAAPAVADRELRLLRAQLGRARKQSALYLERLAVSEWRRSTHGDLLAAVPAVAPLPRRPAALTTLAAALLAALVLWPVLHARTRPAAIAPAVAAPARPRPVAATPVEPRRPGALQLTDERVLVYPGDTAATATVTRDGGSSGDVSVQWWTAGLGARAGRDYVARGRQVLLIPDGQHRAQLRVPILRNPDRRHTEMFALFIGRPGGGATLGHTDRATVFILPP